LEKNYMPNGRYFKSDFSFLEKISMGAIGTKFVFDDLSSKGHKPIELERGSMSFKIWKNIKIKRLRVPDILCIRCGHRIESRAKTKLEISMSHSLSDPSRGWDYGLNNSDYVALVRCNKIAEGPIDWQAVDPVQYVSVKDLRKSFRNNQVILERPKGAEEGFESRITWPTTIASSNGKIKLVSESRLQYQREADNRTITISLSKRGINLMPMFQEGDEISMGHIIASVVPIYKDLPCKKNYNADYYIKLLKSTSITDRYASAKALSFFDTPETRNGSVTYFMQIRKRV
jgi:hypothetical protein